MESSDHKAPPQVMSDRPSLLNTGIRSAPDSASPTRMLAALERDGDVHGARSAGGTRLFRNCVAVMFAAAVLVAAGSYFFGASFDHASVRIASAPLAQVAAVPPGVPAAASGAAVAAAGSSASIESAFVARQATINLNDADTAPAPKPAAAVAFPTREKVRTRANAMRVDRGVVAAAGIGSMYVEANAAHVRTARIGDDDADTELVAAIIARLDRRGAKPASPVPESVSQAADARLAGMLRDCASISDLSDARRCRKKVCDRHWGKDEACPVSRSPMKLPADGVD